jgi:hypothetical protein
MTLDRYRLTSHIIRNACATPSDAPPTSDWGRDDFTVPSWIYGSISTNLFDIVIRPSSTTQTIWDAIENLLRDKNKHLAIKLEVQEHSARRHDNQRLLHQTQGPC